MRTRLVIAMGLLLVAGCGAKGDDDHVLVSDVSETVGAGQCAPVEGPFAVPDGATMEYTLTDIDDTDDMNVGVIDDAAGCSFSDGYGVELDTASVDGSTGPVPAGSYDFVVQCNNLANDCLFSLTWSASY